MTTDKTLTNVAYVFAQYYYGTLHEDPAKLASLYTPTAHLTHSKIPQDDGVNFINRFLENKTCSSKDEIREFYASSGLKSCKIRVTSIDQQPAPFDGSMLISIMGEINLDSLVAVYRFQQTFVLVPSARERVYDVTNDIFRLIPDEDYELEKGNDEAAVPESLVEEQPLKTEETIKVEPQEAEAEALTTETETEVTEPEVIELKVVERKEEVNENLNAGVEAEAKEVVKPEVKEEVKEAAFENESNPTDLSQKENVQANSSWAQLASATVEPKPKPKKSPPAAHSTTAAPLKNVTNQQKSSSPAQQPQAVSGPYLYPVKVDEFNLVNTQDLKEALEKEFGKTTKVEPKGPYALVNFETEAAQLKALAKRTVKVKNHTVVIEKKPVSVQFKVASPAGKQPQPGRTKSNKRPNDKKKK